MRWRRRRQQSTPEGNDVGVDRDVGGMEEGGRLEYESEVGEVWLEMLRGKRERGLWGEFDVTLLHVSILLYRLHVLIYKPLDQKKGEDEGRLRET